MLHNKHDSHEQNCNSENLCVFMDVLQQNVQFIYLKILLMLLVDKRVEGTISTN